MKEIRAVVLGLVVLVIVAAALAFWRRPAPEFSRVKGFKVEVKEKEGDSTRRVSFSLPSSLIARVAKLSPIAAEMKRLTQDLSYIDGVLADGAARAEAIAAETMNAVKDIVGFVRR